MATTLGDPVFLKFLFVINLLVKQTASVTAYRFQATFRSAEAACISAVDATADLEWMVKTPYLIFVFELG